VNFRRKNRSPCPPRALLSGQFGDACNGVKVLRQQASASNPAPPAVSPTDQAWQRLHVAVPVWDLDTAPVSLTTLKQNSNASVTQFADCFDQTLRQRGVQGIRLINPIKGALNRQQCCSMEIRPYSFSP
jgi:hypothetical protein